MHTAQQACGSGVRKPFGPIVTSPIKHTCARRCCCFTADHQGRSMLSMLYVAVLCCVGATVCTSMLLRIAHTHCPLEQRSEQATSTQAYAATYFCKCTKRAPTTGMPPAAAAHLRTSAKRPRLS
jgi:hypothetical protein